MGNLLFSLYVVAAGFRGLSEKRLHFSRNDLRYAWPFRLCLSSVRHNIECLLFQLMKRIVSGESGKVSLFYGAFHPVRDGIL